ncbi:son of sevenless homolog 1-like [Ranitomeya imitator]|uniref:son of sevenless homolog 1-like n=1 Tax=Ranitomeya imitator TaxID=111125 RepID=UPI0037E986DE
MPAIWDPADEAYKDKYARDNCWMRIVRDLYPHYDGYNSTLQQQISKEVKQRWRSVRDRFQKILSSQSKSGSSPVKGNLSLYEELSFLITSRTLRSTEGNIQAPDPVEDSTQDTSESADDTSVLGSTDSIPVVAGTSGICSSSASSADQSDVPITQGTSVVPVPITVPPPKKKLNKKKEDKTTKRVNETIDLLNKSAKEDYLDLFGSTIANKARLLAPERLSKFMSSVHALLDAFEEPAPIAPLADIVTGITRSVRPPPPPPPPPPTPTPPLQHDQRYHRPTSQYYADTNSDHFLFGPEYTMLQ